MKYLKISISLVLLLFFYQNCTDVQNTDNEYRNQLILTGKRCYERGLFWGPGGDISVRIPESNRFIIKGTMNCVGDLDYGKLAMVNLDGILMHGPAPSHETPIHSNIYKLRSDAGAILHMHAPYATAWATTGRKVPAVTQQSVTLLKNCGIVPYYPVGSTALTEAIVDLYKNPDTKVVFMENHGVFIIGADLSDLLYNAEKLENTAKIAYMSQALGGPKEFLPESIY